MYKQRTAKALKECLSGFDFYLVVALKLRNDFDDLLNAMISPIERMARIVEIK